MMRIYNTLSRKKEPFTPKTGKKVRLFVCGITPYDFAHLGHARTYVVFDAFVKYLRNSGYEVFYLQNVTDVDDKIIKRAQETRQTWKAISRKFEKEYLNNMRMLGVNSVDKYARATEHIPEIISQVKQLIKKGYAYEVKNDGIYYDISKFKRYGLLAHRTKEQADDAVSRIDESIKKHNRGDFALWKLAPHRTKGSGAGFEPSWSSPWGKGRPGWHIEDTAITEKYFGPQYDVHGGGIDLIFPHHEAEIAQMEAVSGKTPLVKYWMHTGFLTLEGEKMSKSLGNFITIQDFLKNHSPRVLRLLFLKTHYRSPVDYSQKLIRQTERELERIDEFVEKLRETRNMKRETKKRFKLYASRFRNALEDDFNTPKAIAVIFDLVRKINPLFARQKLTRKDAKETLAFLYETDEIFGFLFADKRVKEKIPAIIMKIAQQREVYRKQNNWKQADELRTLIFQKGWQVEDTHNGPQLKRIGV